MNEDYLLNKINEALESKVRYRVTPEYWRDLKKRQEKWRKEHNIK